MVLLRGNVTATEGMGDRRRRTGKPGPSSAVGAASRRRDGQGGVRPLCWGVRCRTLPPTECAPGGQFRGEADGAAIGDGVSPGEGTRRALRERPLRARLTRLLGCDLVRKRAGPEGQRRGATGVASPDGALRG